MIRSALVLLAFAVAASPGNAAERDGQPHGFGQMDQRMQQFVAQRRAERAADMALVLGLRPDQRPALDAFLLARQPRFDGKRGMEFQGGAPSAVPGTLASLDRMTQRIEQRDAAAKQRIEAERRFYAALSPEQQQRFDALSRLSRHRDRRGFRHGPGGFPQQG